MLDFYFVNSRSLLRWIFYIPFKILTAIIFICLPRWYGVVSGWMAQENRLEKKLSNCSVFYRVLVIQLNISHPKVSLQNLRGGGGGGEFSIFISEWLYSRNFFIDREETITVMVFAWNKRKILKTSSELRRRYIKVYSYTWYSFIIPLTYFILTFCAFRMKANLQKPQMHWKL